LTVEPRFQLIATDVDGTLVDDDLNISQENLAAIARARAAGVKVTLITGRSHYFLDEVVQQVHPDTAVISAGGACLSDPNTGELLDCRLLPLEAVADLIRIAREYETARFISLLQRFYFETPPSLRSRFDYVFGHPIGIQLSDDVLSEELEDPIKVAIYCEERAILEEIAGRALREVRGLTYTFPTPVFIDVTAADASKGAALRRLARRENIPLEQVLVLGDGNNDLTMFQVAGCSVAMANAVPELIEIADHVAPSNNENGFAWALNRLLPSAD